MVFNLFHEKKYFREFGATSAASRITLRGTRGTLHLPAEEPVTDTMLEDSRELPAFLEVMRAKLNRRVPGITEALFPILKGAHRVMRNPSYNLARIPES